MGNVTVKLHGAFSEFAGGTGGPRSDGQSLCAGVNMSWGGPRVEISRDLGKTWKPGKNPAFPKGDERTFSRTWHIEAGHAKEPNVMWAGTEPASLFKSTDRGESWEP